MSNRTAIATAVTADLIVIAMLKFPKLIGGGMYYDRYLAEVLFVLAMLVAVLTLLNLYKKAWVLSAILAGVLVVDLLFLASGMG